MAIVGHGIDLVETARIGQMIEAHGERFLNRCFTDAERGYAAANPRRMHEHLAGRFAVKEAVLKALGTGWSGGIAWTDVEVVRGGGGQPGVRLHGAAAAAAQRAGVARWWVSITHVPGHALASAIAER